MKIVFLDESTITLNNDMDFSTIEALGEFVLYPNSTEAEAVERAGDAEVIIVNKVQMTADVISRLPGLKHIAVIATGYNNIDLKAAEESDIRVTNVSGYARDTVPQHTFALILNLAARILEYNHDVKKGEWDKSTCFTLLTYPTFELAGKTMGIIGFGAIGRGVARAAEGFGMKVLAYDVFNFDNPKYQNTPLDEVLAKSDIVTLHCPLTDDNQGMVNRDFLKKMKDSALFINTARGPLVDEEALLNALNTGEIAGAGIDVLCVEPPKENRLVKEGKNLIVTPHSAWSTREARQRLIDEVAENIKAFMEGRERNIIMLN